jgi:hypothetical protein
MEDFECQFSHKSEVRFAVDMNDEEVDAEDRPTKSSKRGKKKATKSKATKKTAASKQDEDNEERENEKENLVEEFAKLNLEQESPPKVDKATNVREILKVDKEGTVSRTEVRLSGQRGDKPPATMKTRKQRKAAMQAQQD